MAATRAPARVVVVDDFEDLLVRMRLVLEGAGYEVSTFSSPRAFLAAPRPAPPCCLLLDVDMPELTGLEVQQALRAAGKAVPMMFMTGHADVPTAVEAMKGGALDFLLKPFSDATLLAAVERALACSVEQAATELAVAQARRRLEPLTPREREVCFLVAEGLTSREIGERLGVAESTVSVHRARILAKVGVSSVAELVRLADLARAPGAG